MPEKSIPKIRPAEQKSILGSLRTGVTPSAGLHHIQVGRVREVDSLLNDIEHIADGGSAFRLVIGDFGSGKSFFLHLIRAIALQKGLVTLNADLSPDHRLHSSSGRVRNLFAQLMNNCSTRTTKDGGALTSIVERFIDKARKEAEDKSITVNAAIEERLHHLTELVGGYDFAKVISAYWQGHLNQSEQKKSDAIRWLRGEYRVKTEAKNDLGVRTIIDDENVYDHLKLLSLFVRQAGYKGLLVNLDEMVTLYRLATQKSRLSNYDQILRILNDCLQGNAKHLGFLLSGTPDFLKDERKGLFSYEALKSRLAENTFARAAGIKDYSGPTLHLDNLTPEDLVVLLRNLRHVFAAGDQTKYLVPDEALNAFLLHCSDRIGDAYYRTPRNTIKAFLDLLAVLDQNPEIQWQQHLNGVSVPFESNTDMPEVPIQSDEDDDDGLATFRL